MIEQLVKNLGYVFRHKKYLIEALTHASFDRDNNERLEFLGDSLLNLIMALHVFKAFPKEQEGLLTRLRSYLVKESTLAEIARELNLGTYLRLGIGEKKTGGDDRDSLLADAMEAMIAAIYLDGGMEACANCVLHWYQSRLQKIASNDFCTDPKSMLQEMVQSKYKALPIYRLASRKGSDHEQHFIMHCVTPLLDYPVSGEGTSRRRAEQDAAAKVLAILKQNNKNSPCGT